MFKISVEIQRGDKKSVHFPSSKSNEILIKKTVTFWM